MNGKYCLLFIETKLTKIKNHSPLQSKKKKNKKIGSLNMLLVIFI
jgi:hypothetical protein